MAGAAGLWLGTAGPAGSQKQLKTLSKTSCFSQKLLNTLRKTLFSELRAAAGQPPPRQAWPASLQKPLKTLSKTSFFRKKSFNTLSKTRFLDRMAGRATGQLVLKNN